MFVISFGVWSLLIYCHPVQPVVNLLLMYCHSVQSIVNLQSTFSVKLVKTRMTPFFISHKSSDLPNCYHQTMIYDVSNFHFKLDNTGQFPRQIISPQKEVLPLVYSTSQQQDYSLAGSVVWS